MGTDQYQFDTIYVGELYKFVISDLELGRIITVKE